MIESIHFNPKVHSNSKAHANPNMSLALLTLLLLLLAGALVAETNDLQNLDASTQYGELYRRQIEANSGEWRAKEDTDAAWRRQPSADGGRIQFDYDPVEQHIRQQQLLNQTSTAPKPSGPLIDLHF